MINKIHLGDCRKLSKQLADESIDCIISDVPYKIIAGGVNIANPNSNTGGCLNKRFVSDGSTIGNKWLKKDQEAIVCAVKNGKMFAHNDIEFSEFLPEMYRVLKKGTHCYLMVNGRNLKDLQVEAEKVGFVYQNLLIWDKGNLTPNGYYMQGAEFILMLSKRPALRINDMGTSNILRFPNPVGKKRHPTEKPIELMEILINNSTKKGDVVCDFFMGSGATAKACRRTDRDFVGFEIDAIYHTDSLDGLKEVDGKVGLFI